MDSRTRNQVTKLVERRKYDQARDILQPLALTDDEAMTMLNRLNTIAAQSGYGMAAPRSGGGGGCIMGLIRAIVVLVIVIVLAGALIWFGSGPKWQESFMEKLEAGTLDWGALFDFSFLSADSGGGYNPDLTPTPFLGDSQEAMARAIQYRLSGASSVYYSSGTMVVTYSEPFYVDLRSQTGVPARIVQAWGAVINAYQEPYVSVSNPSRVRFVGQVSNDRDYSIDCPYNATYSFVNLRISVDTLFNQCTFQ